MDVSIIIVNYRTPQLIINCLKSVYQHTTNLQFEVIVVDNDPENGGQNLVLSEFPGVRWINMEQNVGFGIANNRGMELATGKYLLLLNADTLLVDPVIETFYDRMESRPNIIAAGAMQYYADHTPIPYHSSFNAIHKTMYLVPPGALFTRLLDRLFPEPQYQDPNECDWLVGAFIFLRSNGFAQTGGFDESFFMYGEDVEWCKRLGQLGKIYYFKDCKFLHLENNNPFRRTDISWINRFGTQMQVSNLLWVRKQFGPFTFLFLMLHYLSMIPVIYIWKIVLNIRMGKKPFGELRQQGLYTKKVMVMTRYFWKILLNKRYLFKILPSENIDLQARL